MEAPIMLIDFHGPVPFDCVQSYCLANKNVHKLYSMDC